MNHTKRHYKKTHNKTHKRHILKLREKKIVKCIESEILCVGAGISSAYMCYQLKEHGVHSKINVIEASDIMGGRLISVYSNVNGDEKVSYDELGGMRIFEDDVMKPIYDIIKKFNIKTVKVSLDDKNNIFFYKNKIYKKPDVRLSNGMTIDEFEDFSLENLKKEYPNFKNKDVYDYCYYNDSFDG